MSDLGRNIAHIFSHFALEVLVVSTLNSKRKCVIYSEAFKNYCELKM